MTRSLLSLLALALLTFAGVADAQPAAQRKKAPDRFARAASDAFVAATEADQQGDLATALGLYQKAFQISPHPSTIYNIGDLQRRMNKLTDAIKSFETYLALSPRASDRAQVEKLIAQLARTPGTVFVTTTQPRDPKAMDLASAYILVDGEIEVRPGTEPTLTPETGTYKGIELLLAPGARIIDVVTPLTHGRDRCIVRPGERSICSVRADPRIDGNVVVSSDTSSLHVLVDPRDADRDSRTNTRFERPPGRARLLLRDRRFECAPLVLDAPAGGDVAYAFVTTKESSTYERCRALQIKRQRLRFAAP